MGSTYYSVGQLFHSKVPQSQFFPMGSAHSEKGLLNSSTAILRRSRKQKQKRWGHQTKVRQAGDASISVRDLRPEKTFSIVRYPGDVEPHSVSPSLSPTPPTTTPLSCVFGERESPGRPPCPRGRLPYPHSWTQAGLCATGY